MPTDAFASTSARSADRSELDVLLEFVDWVGDDLPDAPGGAAPSVVPASRVVDKDALVLGSKPQLPVGQPRAKRGGSEVERLQKAREKERRRYYRNKNRLSSLRRTAANLERQLGSLTIAKQPSSPASPSLFFPDDSSADGHYSDSVDGAMSTSDARSPRERQGRYADLLRMKTRLHDENEQLRRHLSEAAQLVKLLSKRVLTEQQLYLASPASFRLLDPLTVEACASINASRLETIASLKGELWAPAPALVGQSSWADKREVDGDVFKFAISKTFARSSAADASGKVWALLSHPLATRKLFPVEPLMCARVVQKVDQDNTVVLAEMRPEAGDGQVIRSLNLFSRMATSDGFRIIVGCLDKDQVVVEDVLADTPGPDYSPAGSEVWTSSEQLMWIECEERGDACCVTFAGSMPIHGARTSFWMAEAALVCLRAETAVIGSRFALQA